MHQKTKLRVALLFGGRSPEHEVSLASAVGVLSHIDQTRFDVVPIKITRDGRWLLLPEEARLNSVDDLEKASGECVMTGDPTQGGFYRIEKDVPDDQRVLRVDAVFPVLHGAFGEDGTVQGLLALAGLPWVGAGVLGASAGMDKIVMKQLFFQDNLQSADFLFFTRQNWRESAREIKAGIDEEIGYPCFVKPANTGSSVGISKVKSPDDLDEAVEAAAGFDRRILVEKGINARELECAVLGNDHPEASPVGEILPAGEFYDYASKYENADSRAVVPANISEETAQAIQQMAIAAFRAVDCAGLARVDFLLERETGEIFINEINTLPGFTPISMYPQLWKAAGMSYTELITRLIDLALERFHELETTRFHR